MVHGVVLFASAIAHCDALYDSRGFKNVAPDQAGASQVCLQIHSPHTAGHHRTLRSRGYEPIRSCNLTGNILVTWEQGARRCGCW